jgi:hypothetical protein
MNNNPKGRRIPYDVMSVFRGASHGIRFVFYNFYKKVVVVLILYCSPRRINLTVKTVVTVNSSQSYSLDLLVPFYLLKRA